jgi:hypothetical protein
MTRACKSKDFLLRVDCQGCSKHDGPHWGYSQLGELIQWRNKNDKDPYWTNIGSSWSPPGSKRWIHPEKLWDKSYRVVRAREENEKQIKKEKRGSTDTDRRD